MSNAAQRRELQPADRHSDDHWEEAMLTSALDQAKPGPRERWFDLCFRLIILALAGLWLFMPPNSETQRPPDVKAAVTQK
ncbi:hypothetical protein DK26_05470 [Bosea sp. WAO]|uniref:hypothetical protein n=1 Tax=Bosea sp. WAO TaxID=406341 RepID=UPI00074A6946|nr:hypothetical protein [Bosea sp. WAO]KUL96303.1 hypothetical protein DK26_05470 [Bosea sp. WAO]